MKVFRISPVTGKTNVMEIPITQDQIDEFYSPDGRLIQDICPGLTADEREFLISGCTPEDWKTLYGDDGATDTPETC